jgi:hypothetical protein
MSDQLGSIGTTTNGKHPAGEVQPSSPEGQRAQPYSTQSVDERLEALMQTIRTWDWRSASVEPNPPETGEPLASAQISSVPTNDHEDPEIAPVVPPSPAVADAQTLIDTTARHAKVAPLPVEQPDATVSSPMPSPPETAQDHPTPISAAPVEEAALVGSPDYPSASAVEPLPTEQPEAMVPTSVPSPPAAPQDPPTLISAAPVEEAALVGSPELTSTPTVEPLPTEQPEATVSTSVPSSPAAPQDPPTQTIAAPASQFAALLGSGDVPSTTEALQPDSTPDVETPETKNRQRIKVVLLCLAALVVVLLVIGAIRLISDKNQGSGPSSPPPTTAATPPTTHTAASVDQPPLPIPSAEMTQYEQYAQTLQAANTTATKSLTGSSAALTPAEVVPVATIYATALNTYSLELAYIKWPASLQTAVKADQGQLVILAAYLKSIDAVSPTGLDSWLAQMKAQATTTESLDNALRQQLDLPKTTAFPT